MTPQIIWLVLFALAITGAIAVHNEPVTQTKTNGVLIAWRWILTGGLLYWGGFFDPLFK